MTLRGFLMWYVGAVLLVGTAGASGYHVLSRHRAQLAARDAGAPSLASQQSPAPAAAQLVAPDTSMPDAATSPAIDHPSSVAESTPQRRTAAASPHWLPPPHPHLAAVPALRPRLAAIGASHASPPYRLADRRSTASASMRRPAHHPMTQPVTALPPGAYGLRDPYVVPMRSAGIYAQPQAPSVSYYPYPGYPAFQTGYGYYYPRYQYYRVY